MGRKGWFLTDRGVLVVVIALLAVALLENTVAPWAPFYLVYALLTTVVPLALGTWSFAAPARPAGWALALATPVALQLLAGLWLGLAYPALLGALGVGSAEAAGPTFAFDAALGAMFVKAAERFGTAPGTVQMVYLAFILLWAGLGEELFFRGYMHGSLRRRHGFGLAAVVSSAFFAVRHAAQLALLWPDYPWGAAYSWVVFAFAAGLVFSWLYEKTGSLTVPAVAHYILNVAPFLAALAAPGG